MKRLFKYVVPDRIDVLANGTLRFTQPHLFNDPFELQTVIHGLIGEQDVESMDDETLDSWADQIRQLGPELAKKLGRKATPDETRAALSVGRSRSWGRVAAGQGPTARRRSAARPDSSH